MSARARLIIDAESIDLLTCNKECLDSIGLKFISYLGALGEKRDLVAVERIVLPGVQVVELEGPWRSSCWLGSSTVTMGTGEKWGVFLSDEMVRKEILMEVLCLAKILESRVLIGYASGGLDSNADDLAITGGDIDSVASELQKDNCLADFVIPFPDLDRVSFELNRLSDDSYGYFMVRFSS